MLIDTDGVKTNKKVLKDLRYNDKHSVDKFKNSFFEALAFLDKHLSDCNVLSISLTNKGNGNFSIGYVDRSLILHVYNSDSK